VSFWRKDDPHRPRRKPLLNDDADLVRRSGRGDDEAFSELVRRHQEVAFRVAYLVTGHAATAREAVQTSLLKAYQRVGQLREAEAFRGWLLRIVTNEARNHLRAETRWSALTVRAPDPRATQADPEEAAIAGEQQRRLLEALKTLRPEDRIALGMRYFLDLSEAEMADALGWPRGTIKSRLSRSLASLRVRLADLAPTASGNVTGETTHA
jgi:RNA polymerase sigma-70 factor (ECF subfamily)